MKHNKSFSGVDFEFYQQYLETVKGKIPADLYDFVYDSKRHDLAEQSLHDSWINEITIKETRHKKEEFWKFNIDIKIELLGPYHDRLFNLSFEKVLSYQIGVGDKGHQDLLTFEVYCEQMHKKNILVFNAEFADNRAIIIKAKDIKITERLLT